MMMPSRQADPNHRPTRPVMVLDSFVAGLALRAAPSAVATLRAGTALALRHADHAAFRPGERGTGEVQIWTVQGQPLGRMPRDDVALLERLAAPGAPVSAQVSAVVPVFRQARVQVRIAFTPAGAGSRQSSA